MSLLLMPEVAGATPAVGALAAEGLPEPMVARRRLLYWPKSMDAMLLPFLLAFFAPMLEHTDVFRAGEGGYHTYRIPAIVTAADGSLVVFAEARRENRGDPGLGDIDLVTRRSADNGKTWSAMKVVDDPGVGWSASNPTPLLDRSNQRLWIFYNRWEPGFGTEASKPRTMNNQVWARTSDDHGKTWSEARDLTRSARDFENWGAVFLGPGGAIQTKTGRLVVPSAMKYDAFRMQAQAGGYTGAMTAMRSYVFYSDDKGATWKRGGLVNAFCDENQVVELSDGAILMDARQSMGEYRWQMISQDGGVTWSRPQLGNKVTTIAAGIERFGPGVLLWSGLGGPGRRHLVLRVSRDEGQTWMGERTVYGGPAAYSDLTMLGDGTAGVLWERGVSDGYQYVTFTRVNGEWLGLRP